MRFEALSTFAFCLFLTSCSILTPVEVKAPTPVAANVRSDRPGALKKKVLILPFLNHSSVPGDELAKHVTTEIQNAILHYPDLQPVLPEALDNPDGFSADDSEYNYRLVFSKARGYGIAAVIGGTIEDVTIENRGENVGIFRTQAFSAAATLKFDLFDVATERPIISRVYSDQTVEERSMFFWAHPEDLEEAARAKLAVTKALDKALASFPEYARRIAWSGRIAKADLHRYYINAGEATGIGLGQLLKVFEENRPVSDPQTGIFIGMAPGRYKGILRVVDHFGNDGAVAVIQTGGGFREQDRVEIFSPPQNR